MRKLTAVLMALALAFTANTTSALAANAPIATVTDEVCPPGTQLWVHCGENATAYAVITTGRGSLYVFAMGTDANNKWVQSPGQITYCASVLCGGTYSVPGRPGIRWRTIVAQGGFPTSVGWTWCSSRF